MNQQITVKEVEKFWSANPCDSDRSVATDRKTYFEEIEKSRYKLVRHIPEVARFDQFKEKMVLEVGCGIGTDGRQFVKNGAVYYGINVDEGSTELAREGFEIYGLHGNIRQMNAEAMEFENNFFDHVYSCGVIHHSPNTEKIVSEMYRILKPGGTVQIMIYNKSSVNYHFNIMFLRKMFRILLIPPFAPKLFAKLTGFSEHKLQRHRQIFLSEKMTRERWISINTDGPDCPLAKVYNRKQAIDLFTKAGFIMISTYVRFFNKTHFSFLGKLIPDSFADWIGNRWGWLRWVEALKPIG